MSEVSDRGRPHASSIPVPSDAGPATEALEPCGDADSPTPPDQLHVHSAAASVDLDPKQDAGKATVHALQPISPDAPCGDTASRALDPVCGADRVATALSSIASAIRPNFASNSAW